MRTNWIIAIGLTGIAVASIGALLFWPASGAGDMLKPDDPEVRAEGAALYTTQCASCHGRTLEGQPNWQRPGADGKLPAPPHDETGHTWHHPDAMLFAITKLGTARAAGLSNYESDMPAYEGTLTDAEIIAVLSFIKSTWPEEIRRRHDALNASAAGQ